MELTPIHAVVRFGLGRRGAHPLPDDPASWLAQQLEGHDAVLDTPALTGVDGLIALRDDTKLPVPPGQEPRARRIRVTDTEAALRGQIFTEAPFRERLVWFWANHFTVSYRNSSVMALAGAFVREAIRPHVTGHFRDMLFAVMRHPAMLLYLDNAHSVGPNSPAGIKHQLGLNENLARECLELHTVSPTARYTQADVTAFARVLTGWSVDRAADPPLAFLFRANWHEPGPKIVMEQTVPPGEAGGVQMLTWLADHPATHRHLATKLACHFIDDEPTQDDVQRIERVLADTGGDLKAVALDLVATPRAWRPLIKLRSPTEYVVATVRALDLPEDKLPQLSSAVGRLGQPFMNPLQPKGWPDTASGWIGPAAMVDRVDWSYGIAARAAAEDPATVAQNSLDSLIDPATAEAVRRAGSRRDALTLLLTSPEFQRR